MLPGYKKMGWISKLIRDVVGLVAWSSGNVSAFHPEDWSYGREIESRQGGWLFLKKKNWEMWHRSSDADTF
jgi:hypothetical protein